MIIETDKPHTSVVADARSILLVHTPNEDGLCVGCYEFACALARFPCSQAQWAQELLAAGGEQFLKPLHARVLIVRSEPRAQIYGALLAEPGRDWSIRELAAQLPGVPVEAVTATLHTLMGERLMEPVPHHQRLTLRLNADGRSAIQEMTDQWAGLKESS